MAERANIQKRLQRLRNLTLVLSIGTLTTLALLLTFVPIDEKAHARGRIHAEQETYVRCPVEGVLSEIRVHVGDRVGKGEVLAQLDATDAQGRLRMVDARLEQARAELDLKQKRLEAVRKAPLPKEFRHSGEEYEAATKRRAQAQTQYARIKPLGEEGAVSQQHVEAAQLELSLATAEYEKAGRNLRIVEGGLEQSLLKEAEAEVHSSQEALRILEVERATQADEVARHTIRAPREGVITLILRRTPGEEAAKGADLFHLAHGEPSEANLYATEREYHRIAPGQEVVMTSPAFNRLRHGYIRGHVVRRAIEAERETPPGFEPPVYRVTVQIEHSPQQLTLGTSIDAEIILARTPLWQLLFPTAALK